MASRRQSSSVLDIPGTPLLGPQPIHPLPDHNIESRRKKGFACAGILVLTVVIIVALVLVGVKQSQTVGEVETESQISLTSTTTTSTKALEHFNVSKSMKSDNSRGIVDSGTLTQLHQMMSKCRDQKLENDDCKMLSDLATQQQVEDLGAELKETTISSSDEELTVEIDRLSRYLNDMKEDENPTFLKIMNMLKGKRLTDPNVVEEKIKSRMSEQGEDDDDLGLVVVDVVHCDDDRELRCRDKTACYPVQAHCDFKVDCKDNSDEDACTCVDRLIDDRKCDSYNDCPGADDESSCGCEQGQFFCKTSGMFGPSECVGNETLCDGKDDCSNGRDETDCLLLGTTLDKLTTRQAASSGYLGLWRPGYVYLPVCVTGEGNLSQVLGKKVCYGQDRGPMVTSLSAVPPQYRGEIARLDTNWTVLLDTGDDCKLVLVDCGMQVCDQKGEGVGSGRARMDTSHEPSRWRMIDTYNPECDDIFANMTPEEKHDLLNDDERYKEMCSLNDTKGKIVGGEISRPDSWPFTVAVKRDSVLICGATIISPEWVITAAHCFHGYLKGVVYQVRAGMLRRQSQSPWEQFRTVKDVYIHMDYNNVFFKHDIALLRLSEPLSLNLHVQSVCLPQNPSMSPPTGSTCMATGWGDVSEDGPSSEFLKEVEIPIVKKGRSYNDATYQIFGGYPEGGKDACQGDSGGPLYCKTDHDHWYLGGVISHGRGCARKGEAGVYVRLSYYIDWIKAVRGGWVKSYTPCEEDQSCSPLAQECGGVTCASGKCVPVEWVCDEQVDCLGGEDTRDCVTLANGTRLQINEHKKVRTLSSMVLECNRDEWKCKNVDQCIKLGGRCNGKKDCPDWSDEEGCKCRDLIPSQYVCDGLADCKDLSDEENCNLCGEGRWRCPLSGQCVEGEARCDTVTDCRWGEDEKQCTALTDKSFLPVSSSGNPIPSYKGLLVINKGGSWSPACVTQFNQPLVENICRYMGWAGGQEYQLVPKRTSVLAGGVETEVEGRSRKCYHTDISCESSTVCGVRTLYKSSLVLEVPSDGPGVWPWQVNLFSDGEFVCGATIVHQQFLVTAMACARLVVNAGPQYVTAVVGQVRKTGLGGSSHVQIRRVVSIKAVRQSDVVVVMLETPLQLNDYVNKICLTSQTWIAPDSVCFMSGATEDNWMSTIEVEIGEMCGHDTVCIKAVPPNVHTKDWAGALVCPDSKGRYLAVGVFHSRGNNPPTKLTSIASVREGMLELMQEGLRNPARAESDKECEGLRCKEGRCVGQASVCDRIWDCPNGEDEVDCQYQEPDLTYCQMVGGNCTCPTGWGKCTNNLCVMGVEVCNGKDDCGDGSDEVAGCSASCSESLQFTNPDYICDNRLDCPDKGDESAFSCGCGLDMFRCDSLEFGSSTNVTCVPVGVLCDGKKDCPNGEDEVPGQCVTLAPNEGVSQDQLHVPEAQSSGYLKMRLRGSWFSYCSLDWKEENSASICKSLGMKGLAAWVQHAPIKQVNMLGGSDEVSGCQSVFITCLP